MYVCAVDDGVYPLLGNIGPSSIALFTGSTFQQSWLANIAEEIDVSKVGTVNWAVDPNVGPTGKPKLVMPVEGTSRVTWLTLAMGYRKLLFHQVHQQEP
jgi:hypothetical protein